MATGTFTGTSVFLFRSLVPPEDFDTTLETDRIVTFIIDRCPGGDLNALRHSQTEQMSFDVIICFYAAELILAGFSSASAATMSGASQVISVHPDEIVFEFELEKWSYCILKVVNNTEHHVAFKAKTTSPRKYFVRPNNSTVQL